MTDESRWQNSLTQLEKALKRLREALNESPDNPLFMDATIQRFEFTIELFWKNVLSSVGVGRTGNIFPQRQFTRCLSNGLDS
jgi:Nucleotidyltransferase substrate binding protein like